LRYTKKEEKRMDNKLEKKFRPNYTLSDSTWSYAIMVAAFFTFGFALPLFILLFTGTADTFTELWFTYVAMAFTQLMFLAVFLSYNRVAKINFWKATGLNHKPNLIIVTITIVIGVVCLFGFNQFIGLVDHGINTLFNLEPSILNVNLSNFAWFLLLALLIAVFPAIIEEVLFRGLIFRGLLKNFKPAAAITLSALMFALMHFSINQFVYQFMLGIIYAAIAYYTGKLIYSIIAHFINNFVLALMVYIQVTLGIEPAAAAGYGVLEIIFAVGGAILTAAAIVGLIFLIKKLAVKPKEPEADSESQSELNLKKYEGLSEYEIKLKNSKIATARGWFLGVMIVVGLIWITHVVDWPGWISWLISG
jgi:membrane protease YdiL (CAAX protease family)